VDYDRSEMLLSSGTEPRVAVTRVRPSLWSCGLA